MSEFIRLRSAYTKDGEMYGEPVNDVVPVIRCQDCKYYDHDKLDPTDEGLCSRRIATETMVKENHFCGYAVRKEDTQ